MDLPVERSSLKDFELFGVSYTTWGVDEEGWSAKTIVFGTLRYDEDEGCWVPDQESHVTGGGSMVVRPVTVSVDYEDWERAVFKISATDSYGSKVAISGTYTCASGPPVYYINLMIKLTGQVYEYDQENSRWLPTGDIETHVLRLSGYPQDYYNLPPYWIMAYAYHDQLTWFPPYWPLD